MNRYLFPLLTAFCLTGQASEIPWQTTSYSYLANQEPLNETLENLLSSQGLPVVISETVNGTINAEFKELPPAEVFEGLADAFKLTWYYDGNVLYIYRLDEVRTATLELEGISVDAFKQSLAKLDILDERFSWRAIDHEGLIYLSGPQRYIELVEQMAARLDHPPAEDTGDKIYMWTDSDGVMNYSSAPPKNVGSNTDIGAVTIERPATTEAVVMTVTAP